MGGKSNTCVCTLPRPPPPPPPRSSVRSEPAYVWGMPPTGEEDECVLCHEAGGVMMMVACDWLGCRYGAHEGCVVASTAPPGEFVIHPRGMHRAVVGREVVGRFPYRPVEVLRGYGPFFCSVHCESASREYFEGLGYMPYYPRDSPTRRCYVCGQFHTSEWHPSPKGGLCDVCWGHYVIRDPEIMRWF